MDIHFLSSWLFFYQFLMAVLLSPLIYILQGQEFKKEKILFFEIRRYLFEELMQLIYFFSIFPS